MYLMFCWWGGNVYTLTPKASEMYYTYAAPSSTNGIKYTGMASVFPVSAPLAQKNGIFSHCVLWCSMQEPSIDVSFCIDQFLHHHISCLSFALCFMIFHLRNQWILMLLRFSMLQDPFIECGEFSILRRRRQVVLWYLAYLVPPSPKVLCYAVLPLVDLVLQEISPSTLAGKPEVCWVCQAAPFQQRLLWFEESHGRKTIYKTIISNR